MDILNTVWGWIVQHWVPFLIAVAVISALSTLNRIERTLVAIREQLTGPYGKDNSSIVHRMQTAMFAALAEDRVRRRPLNLSDDEDT